MSVYVDDMKAPFGNMVMCHMWADSDEELLAMVDLIGVQRKWIQGHKVLSFGKHRNASWVHFDISMSKRAQAVRAGAIETDRFGPLEYTSKLVLAAAEAAGDQMRADAARARLATVADLRAKRADATDMAGKVSGQ